MPKRKRETQSDYVEAPVEPEPEYIDPTLPNQQNAVADDEDAGLYQYTHPSELPGFARKYWRQRYDLFEAYDYGIWMTPKSWFGVTPECVANKIADHIARGTSNRKKVIVDCFAGVGGNTIAFALSGRWEKIVAIEMDAPTLEAAKRNAEIYEVAHLITWVQGDCFEILKNGLDNLIGPEEKNKELNGKPSSPHESSSDAEESKPRSRSQSSLSYDSDSDDSSSTSSSDSSSSRSPKPSFNFDTNTFRSTRKEPDLSSDSDSDSNSNASSNRSPQPDREFDRSTFRTPRKAVDLSSDSSSSSAHRPTKSRKVALPNGTTTSKPGDADSARSSSPSSSTSSSGTSSSSPSAIPNKGPRNDIVIFGSPPWGGPGYRTQPVFDVEAMQPYGLSTLYNAFTAAARDVALFLPRTSDLNQIARYAPEDKKMRVSHYYMGPISKAVVAYFGDFRFDPPADEQVASEVKG